MIRVSQIDHVTFVVRDLAASRRFYVELLGMENVPRPAFDFAGLWFRAGSTLLHLILEHDRSGPAGVNEDGRVKSTRGFHLAFAVADAEAAAAALEAAGVTFVTKPKLRPDGAVQTFILDPDGHVIELSSPPRVQDIKRHLSEPRPSESADRRSRNDRVLKGRTPPHAP